jgi:RNA polymerase sigma factor (sigma-70 family)
MVSIVRFIPAVMVAHAVLVAQAAHPCALLARTPAGRLTLGSSMSASDFELLTAWRAGENDCGNQLFGRHVRTVLRFFRNKADDAAEDLTQRTFLALVEARDQFRGDASFRTYLFAVARGQLLMHFRGRALDNHRIDPLTWSAVDGGMTPPRGAIAREEQALVLEAMRRIPLDYQLALELFYWEELAVAEIAEVCGAPAGTIKARLSRGRELLRERIIELVDRDELLRSTLDDVEGWIRSLPPIVSAVDESAGA